MKRLFFNNFNIIILALLGSVVLVACKKQEIYDVDQQTSYFGLKQGTFIEYDVTYMFHDSLLAKHDTLMYQIRTVIGDTFIDNSGRIAREFKRFKRKTASQPWVEKDLWIAIIENGRAELVEENQRKIKLVFRPTEDKKWDINTFNNLGTLMASYSGIGQAKEVNGLSFPATLTVEQEDYKTLIDLRRKYEVYANGVGMILKEDRDLTYKFGSPTPIKGEEYFYKVFNYGVQ